MKKLIRLTLFVACMMFVSCGSFGEGMMAALGGYNPYGYNAYGYGYGYGSNANYLLDPSYAAAQATVNGNYSSTGTSSYSSTSSSRSTTTTTRKQDCPSLKVSSGKWYCANTGKCGMCGGDGRMDGSFGQGANSLKCTLCNGSGKCKYCH